MKHTIMLSLSLFAASWICVAQDKEIAPKMSSVNVTWDEDSQTGHTATLRWIEQLPEPDGIKVNRYKVWRSLSQDTGFKLRSGVGKGVTMFVDKTVVSGKTYWYYVTALSVDGRDSDPSVTVAVTVP
jgi:fibronectin type 3 domain-containing protein